MNRQSGFALIVELLLVTALIAFIGLGSFYYGNSLEFKSGKSNIENNLEAIQEAKDLKNIIETKSQTAASSSVESN